MDMPPQKQSISDSNQEQNYNEPSCNEELPQVDPPSEQNHPNFFKVKTRIDEQHLNVQIGLLAIKYQHFQEDFVTYLANMLMCEVQFLNVFIVDPLHLYISMNAATNEGVVGYEYVGLQRSIYKLLCQCRQLIKKFIQNNISQHSIFSEDGPGSQQIIAKFQQQVIKLINQQHTKLFASNSTTW